MKYLIIILSTILVNNVIFSQFLGICPFLGTSKKTSTALGMGAAVIFVLTLSTLVTWLVNQYILLPLGLEFLQTIAFILIIAALVQMVEIILKKISPSLYTALGVFLPLITTNCAVLGVSLTVVTKEFNYGGVAHMLSLGESVVYAAGIACGFALALIIFAGVREHTELMEVPEGMKGTPIALITAGILALAFMGFTGIV
ncbi:MAG: RnfABCDGE type electron transport complex subunit A [Bacteroidales bacterium]|nr:RnfABCDGE type electron transport complex subunit A [Bacteroidales bacterium]MCQ2303753.1 RnfABCDGE type electron transport complex subunit A [Bacteroidales bacterium]